MRWLRGTGESVTNPRTAQMAYCTTVERMHWTAERALDVFGRSRWQAAVQTREVVYEENS